MRGDTSFFNVFREILEMCFVRELSFTKNDIEEMPPFERTSYIQMIEDILKDRKEKEKIT